MRNRSLLIGILTLAGCATNYEYIAPISISYIPTDAEDVELVTYRQLAFRDYRAPEPAPAYMSKKDKIGAQTTIIISAAPLIDAVEIPSNPDSARWESVIEGLTFSAVMVPEASWWNPKKTKWGDIERILEHEQVHFAIMELEARRMSVGSDQLRKQLVSTGPTQIAAITRTMRKCTKEKERLSAYAVAMNAKYDLETKNGTDRKEQRRWVARIERMMAESDSTEAMRYR